VPGHLLLNFEGERIVWNFGSEPEIAIPDGIKRIGQYALAFRTSILSLVFDSSPTFGLINAPAFGQRGLSTMHFQRGVRELHEGAFAGCESMSRLTFEPRSYMKRIEAQFAFCGLLEAIIVSSSVEFIGDGCFDCCLLLSTLTFEHPSHLRELRSLPTATFSLDIPDSVEVLVTCPASGAEVLVFLDVPDDRPTIRVGEGSRLEVMEFSTYPGGGSGGFTVGAAGEIGSSCSG
jgi:hypothetical protein